MAERSKAVRTISALAFLAAIGSCYALIPGAPPLTPQQQVAKDASEKMLMAMIRCENQTKDLLADPSGFDPEPQGKWIALAASEDRYVVRFKARAKNAFGALIWGTFECTATYDGERWTAEVRALL